MNRYLNPGALVAALSLLATGATPAADFHPEDAACQTPCEVRDASSAPEPDVSLHTQRPTQQQPSASKAATRKHGSARTVNVAQKGEGSDGKREPALARQ